MQPGVRPESDPQIREGSELLQLEAEKPHRASGLPRATQRQRASFHQDGIEVERGSESLGHIMKDVELLTLPLSIGASGLRHAKKSFDFQAEVVKLYAALRRPGNDLK